MNTKELAHTKVGQTRQGDRDLSGSKVYDVILTWWW